MWSKWRGSLRRITLRSLNEYIQTMGVLRSLPNHARSRSTLPCKERADMFKFS
jgi:hypothetical protein